jgi:molybdenum-dependent DNA-binding transcriptional regulator ModE
MMGQILMSQKESYRNVILNDVINGKLTLREAAEELKLSYRQAKRVLARYRKAGPAGLIHKNRGRKSNRAYCVLFKENVLKRYNEIYEGFGPTLASEKLNEDGYKIKAETLRKWLIKDGQWSRHRKRRNYRKRRERRPCFGDLLQLDGSIHEWFGVGTGHTCLMNIVDDATGTTLSLMDTGETTKGAMSLLWEWIKHYGIPKAVYVDLKTLYVLPQKEKEIDLAEGLSVFGKACAKLGIKIIKAYSAQAKGRVERNHGVYQDRFVKELKLKKITTIEAANNLLYAGGFIKLLNNKFAKLPLDKNNGHRKLPSSVDLNDIFCWEIERVVQNDWTVRYKNSWYQINRTNPLTVRSGHKIIIIRHLDEVLSMKYKDKKINFTALEAKLEKPKENTITKKSTQELSLMCKNNSTNSPWRTYNPWWIKTKKQLVVNSDINCGKDV